MSQVADYPAAVTANGQFNLQAYLQARPDLVQNYISDPGYGSFYGSLANYALADAAANGGPQVQQLIQAGSIALPAGATITPNGQGGLNVNVGSSSLADTSVLPALGYTQQGGLNEQNMPLEEALLQGTLPSVQNLVGQTPANQALAASLAQQEETAAQQTAGTLGQAIGGGFDGKTYVQNSPAAGAAWQAYQQSGGTQDINSWAQQYYQTTGQQQGDKPAYINSALTSQENFNDQQAAGAQIGNYQQAAATATTANAQEQQTQLGALQQSIAQMQQGLTGDLAAKAQALQQNLQLLQQNLGTATQAQLQALSTQIGQQQADLNTSIASQKQALTTQISTLQGAADTQSQQQLAALQTELSQLNTAEAPMAQARTQAAQLQVTGINLGLQQTETQLQAQNAAQGYYGGSSMQDAALARAAIGAQQNAAANVGAANTANAQDYQAIANQGATGQMSIADQLAQQQAAITGQGAQGNYGLSTALAQGTQQLGDTQAQGTAAINANAALQGEANLNSNANQNLALQQGGADQNLALTNSLAQGSNTINQTAAQQQFGIGTSLAANTLGAQNTSAQQQLSNQQNQYSQGLQAEGDLLGLPATVTGNLTDLSNYGTSGLTQAQNLLNWWSTNSQAPTEQAPLQTASTAGNSIAGLGSALVGGAFGVGNANKWWATGTPNTNTPNTNTTTVPPDTSGAAGGSGVYVGD